MADEKLVDILMQGSQVWNGWRDKHPEITKPDLTDIVLGKLTKRENRAFIDLRGVNLSGADLRDAKLMIVQFHGANLKKANLGGVDLSGANLTGANLEGVNLRRAILEGSHLNGANLRGANLQNCVFISTDVEQSILTDCQIFGISAWNLKGIPKDQANLVITQNINESKITVDDIRVAQFIYLLLDNKNVRNLIDTITSKAVLILGRFTDERKKVLDALKEALRQRNYLPILFDFEGSQSRNLTETVSTLAHMAKFVIADITDAKSIPQELMAIVPHTPSLPIQPLLLATEKEYAMFKDYSDYQWVLKTCHYSDIESLLASLQEKVIQPAEDYLAANHQR